MALFTWLQKILKLKKNKIKHNTSIKKDNNGTLIAWIALHVDVIVISSLFCARMHHIAIERSTQSLYEIFCLTRCRNACKKNSIDRSIWVTLNVCKTTKIAHYMSTTWAYWNFSDNFGNFFTEKIFLENVFWQQFI